MPNPAPTDEVLSLKQSGKTTSQITEELQKKGFSIEQINEAINQASIKSGVEGGAPEPPKPAKDMDQMQESILSPDAIPKPPTPEAPAPEPAPPMPEPAAPMYPQTPPVMQPPAMPAEPSIGYEDVQALVEEVIEEKWKEFTTRLGDVPTWKSEVNTEVESIKQELLRLERRFEDMQTAIFGKVKEYGSSMQDLGSEMKALEKVFEKIIGPMTSNIKELENITSRLKTGK